MQTLTVELGERRYPIYIGRDVLHDAKLLKAHIHGRQVCVVTNETVAPLYLSRLEQQLSNFQLETVILPDGEQYKNLDTLNRIFDALLEARHNRTTTLIALGGGVVGDITGFAAASYQRGVAFIQIPTTLLAQVDSSVGGKTGVNHALGKNMIGAFHQPNCVLVDTEVLQTLPAREISAGIAEIVKYGLIIDGQFLSWLEDNMDALVAQDPGVLAEAIQRSCELKAQIVAQDETENSIRAILNLGHTFGHAIETALGYGQWLHGEAVAAGMVVAASLSHRLGWLDTVDVKRVEALLLRAGLPVSLPKSLSAERMLSLMLVDKKVLDGRPRFVLLKAIGEAVVRSDIKREDVVACLGMSTK